MSDEKKRYFVGYLGSRSGTPFLFKAPGGVPKSDSEKQALCDSNNLVALNSEANLQMIVDALNVVPKANPSTGQEDLVAEGDHRAQVRNAVVAEQEGKKKRAKRR